MSPLPLRTCCALITLALSACDLLSATPSTSEPPLVSGARGELLNTLARQVYPSLYTEALTRAQELRGELEGWRGEASDSTQGSWRALSAAWQRAELAQVGPAGVSGLRVGGRDLRDLIYSFPLHNPCRVDQELTLNTFSEPGWAARAVISARGIDALERLLFATSDENACDPAININRDGTWAALSREELTARRRALALVLSDDLIATLTELTEEWGQDGASARALAAGSAPFASQREALDQVYAALLYLDKQCKDLKLALPAGLSPDCLAERCPERLEHPLASFGRDALIANVEGFLMVFEGRARLDAEPEEGLVGFDDVLAGEGAEELAEDIKARAAALLVALRALDPDLALTLRERPEALLDAHEQLKELTDLLKSQLAAVLNLSLPMEGAGDND